MSKKSAKQLIVETLKEKSCMKQDVYQNTINAFEELKEMLQIVSEELRTELDQHDKRIQVGYKSLRAYDAELRFAGDVLLFHMHSNVFEFDNSHHIWNLGYVKEDEQRAYCGIINVYNFLSDSLKYNRDNDSGYLVARIFVNKENHFFVEGKRQLGVLYNNFSTEKLTKERMKDFIESCILYSLDFDLLTPPYHQVQEISVWDIKEISSQTRLKTGKRVGFQFSALDDGKPS